MEPKKYPAADLTRKSKLFFSIGLCTSLLLTTLVFEWKIYESKEVFNLGEMESEYEELMEIPPTEQPPPPSPKIVNPQIVEVVDEEEIMEDLEIDLDIEITQESVIEEQIIFEAEEIEEEVAEEIFVIVEEQPIPQGGYPAFYQYVAENLEYPRHARSAGIEGKVYVQFVVNTDGTLTDVIVIKGIGGGCDEEAVRVLKNAPPWHPGKQRGRAVKVRMVLPIAFTLTYSSL